MSLSSWARDVLHIKYMRTSVTGEANTRTYLVVLNHTVLLPNSSVIIA
jgi:hypothetical protein